MTGGDNIAIAGCILRNFRLRMPGVFSLKGDTLKVPGGLAFSELRGYEARQVVSISRDGDLMAAILGNPAMIDAYLAGVLGNGVDVRQPDDLTPDIEQRKGLGGDTIAQAVGQRVVPGGILGLQRDQPRDRVVPTLSSTPVLTLPFLRWSDIFDSHRSPLTLCS